MRAPDGFATPRLILRASRPDDAAAIFAAYAQDPDVSKYVVWRPHKTVMETQNFLLYCDEERRAGRNHSYVIMKKDDQWLVGMLSLGSDGGVGYVLARAQWGQGYMTEAVKAVVEWARVQADLPRIWATCDVDNPASARVMVKAGLKFEARLPRHSRHPNISDELRDAFKYSMEK